MTHEPKSEQSFLRIDPLAEEREWLSPYNFVQNNPINRIDPDGALDMGVQSPDTWLLNADTGEATYIDDDSNDIVVLGGSDYNSAVTAGTKAYECPGECDNNAYNSYQGLLDGGTRVGANEFGLVQLTKMGNDYIFNNKGLEDFYKYQNKNGSYSNRGQHGDDWMQPESAIAFYNSVNKLAEEEGGNLEVIFNDASGYNPVNNKPYYNLGHSRRGGHSNGTAFDMRFLKVGGKSSNNVHSLTKADRLLNSRFISILKSTGRFSKFFSDGGLIKGSGHAKGHADHLHGQ